jgi:hypothetical protein
MLNKGPQVGGMYVLMSKPENTPITKSLGPDFLFDQAPGQEVKNIIFKSRFFQNLAIGGLQVC